MKRFVLLGLLCALPARVFAQPEPTSIEVRGALGIANYLHGDLGYTAPTWLASIRFGMGPLAIEPEFAAASHETRQVFGPAPGSPQGAVTISIDRYRSAAVNVLGRFGRSVSGYAGGGPGMYWEPSEYRLEAGPNSYEQNRTRGPRLGVQLVAGLDVPIGWRVKAFGQFRYEVRSLQDPGGGSVVQGLAGAAIVLR